ncbi:MAG: cation-transporting P-type ATPase, partial [Armatimonadetes bacterium]|nr:cation-transporting P-type ATPase [Armatimonadota bacterium]
LLTGEELDRLPPEELTRRVREIGIFARVRPEQKHSIIEALQRAGAVVAMTGDGVNDVPALRRADVAISLGRRASAAARAAADLVLQEDSRV